MQANALLDGFAVRAAGHTDVMAFRETLGIEVKEKGRGEARLTFEARDEHLNDGGVVHGGAIATLIDCAMGSAVASLFEDRQPLTVETKINYLEPGAKGTLIAEARVRRSGKRFTVLEAEVVQDGGSHVAYATGTFTLVE